MLQSEQVKLVIAPQDTDICYRVCICEPFRFFFTLDGKNTAPSTLISSREDGIPDFVLVQLRNLKHAFHVYVDSMHLPDFRFAGVMSDSGVRFVDIHLDDLPIQLGLASAKVLEVTPEFLKNTPWVGPSVNLRLHRALPASSLTPAHELFHIFQYAALPFRNMWFMEGLARHGQRWLGNKPLKLETLPSDRHGLETVLRRWHEAEAFWNSLSNMCLTDNLHEADSARAELGGQLTYPFNKHLRGNKFVSVYFSELKRLLSVMREDMPSRDLSSINVWTGIEAKSASNNRYLLRAIHSTAIALNDKPSSEFRAFLNLIQSLEQSLASELDSNACQNLFFVIERHGWAKVHRNNNGFLRCDSFDPVTATLSISNIIIDSSVTREDLLTFSAVRGVVGDLKLVSLARNMKLNGLDNLVSIEGSLTIESTDLEDMMGCFPRLVRVKGSLIVKSNADLKFIDGFHQLESIDDNLLITDSPLLEKVVAFSKLIEIKKGRLEISKCVSLRLINAFEATKRLRDVLIDKLAIANVDFLGIIFSCNAVFPGFIKITGCRIDNLLVFKSVTSVKSSLYLHGNKLKNVDGLNNLVKVGGSLSLGGNKLENLDGLSSLREINGILNLNNNQLRSLKGLDSLVKVKSTLWNKVPRTIQFENNPRLTDISSLANVGVDEDYIILHCDQQSQYLNRPASDSRFHRNILQIHQAPTRSVHPTCLWTGKSSHDYSNFRSATHNKKFTYLHDFEVESDVLVMSFAGVNGNLGGIFYNRYNLIIDGVNSHKIFMSDPTHRWYHGGIPDLTRSMDETVEYLRNICRRQVYRKIVCIGVSMGAYMALLIGHEVGATDILAFSPQTFIDAENRSKYRDYRWKKMIERIPVEANPDYMDLARLYRRNTIKPMNTSIFYGVEVAADVDHVRHFSGASVFNLRPYETDQHTISLYLDKQLNVLNDIVRSVVI